MQLALATLGTLQASTMDAQGGTRSLGRGKPTAMLAYLASIPGRKASREHLATLLWGDVETEAARQNLRQTVWYLKKKLGDGLLDSDGEMLSLIAPYASDRDDFLQAAQRADFATAVQLFTGPFIPDFAAPGASEFEQWCDLERRRLTVTYLRCADALARQWMSEGHFREAQELARKARDADPMDQATWRLLLETLVAGSDGLGATSEAEHLEAFLAREEQEPEAATLAALRAARRSPTAQAASDAGPSASIAAELVGRETEFSHVLTAWEQARGGMPRVLVISAAAGLGKSRLLRDVHARLRASRSRCVLMRANPGDRHLGGGFAAAIATHLAELPGAAAVSPGSAGVLVSLAPSLASIYSSASADRAEGEEAVRHRALALVDLMQSISDEHPVALLLDDLHWADEQSARILSAALSRLEHARLLVVLTRRPVADPHALFAAFERLSLPPLDLAAVTSFVAHVADLPASAWADVLPQQLLLATGGSPLLLVETLHDALEQGWLSVSDGGVWECEDPLRVTNTLREGSALQHRTSRLPPCAQRTLLVLSLLGRPAEAHDVQTIVGCDAETLREHVDVLERGGFVMRLGSQLLVAHDEIAAAVMDATPDEDRREVHADIARSLLAASPKDEIVLRRAAEHAISGDAEALLRQAWRAFLAVRRRIGDHRGTRRLAAEFLGMASGQRAVLDLVAATPWFSRQRTRWIAAASVLVAATAALALSSREPAALTSDFTFWTTDSATGRTHFVGVRIPRDSRWDDNSPLEAVDLDSTQFPRSLPGSRGPWLRSPNGKEWWTDVVDSSLGDESAFLDSLGQLRLPMASPGDDGIGDFSPDGRWYVGVTARFDTVTDHMHVVTGDPRGGLLRRLTFTQDADRNAFWRPDGTQIAFQRHYYTVRSLDRVCLVDVDGVREQCLRAPLQTNETMLGWMDERRVMVQGLNNSLWMIDVVTQSRTRVEGIAARPRTFVGDLQVCDCWTSEGALPSIYVFPNSNPATARPVQYQGRPLRGTLRHAAPLPRARRWLDTLRIEARSEGYSLSHSHRLRVRGVRADGAPAWLHDLRWTSRDPSVATVDTAGVLRPRRIGSVWVVVSAGGWRTDSAQLRIVAEESRAVLVERWGADWEHRWRPFGIPAGVVVPTARGPALLPNGDGSYGSGAYLRRPFAGLGGAGVEAEVSMLVNGTQWQTLVFDLVDARVLERVSTWDHRTGDKPAAGNPFCTASFPGTEGATFRDHFSLSGRVGTQILESFPALLNGSWHRVRLQLLPDGRCALALDGRPLAAVLTDPPTDSLVLSIAGNDRLGGRLIVGPLEVWTGVRGGVDWTKLDQQSPPP